MTAPVELKWGHPVVNPYGVVIRLPHTAFRRLRLLGLLERDENGLQRISDRIHELMHHDYDSIMGDLRQMLGKDFSGPEWVDCRCRDCRRFRAYFDRTRLPKKMLAEGYKRAMERQRGQK